MNSLTWDGGTCLNIAYYSKYIIWYLIARRAIRKWRRNLSRPKPTYINIRNYLTSLRPRLTYKCRWYIRTRRNLILWRIWQYYRAWIIRGIRYDFMPWLQTLRGAIYVLCPRPFKEAAGQYWVHATWLYCARFLRRIRWRRFLRGYTHRAMFYVNWTLLKYLTTSHHRPNITHLISSAGVQSWTIIHLKHLIFQKWRRRHYLWKIKMGSDARQQLFILVVFLYWATIGYAHAFSKRGRNIMYRDFYECGFRMIPDMRAMLDIQFSVIGIIFLIYDMEIVLLTPLLVNLVQLPLHNIFLILIVLLILGLSYAFEWDKYTLTWTYT